MEWKTHTVWIEFSDKKEAVTLTDVQDVRVASDVVTVSWLDSKKKILHTYHYPLSRVLQLRESNVFDGDFE